MKGHTMSRLPRRGVPLRPRPLAVAAVAAIAVAGTATAVAVAVHATPGHATPGPATPGRATPVPAAPNGSRVTVSAAADSAAPLRASYQAGNNWGTGYSGQYVITNAGNSAVTGWTLAFTLPGGTGLTSLWDGKYTASGGRVTVTADGWDATIQPGKAVTVGFVTKSAGPAGQPGGCAINGVPCGSGAAPAAASPPPAAAAQAPVPATPAGAPSAGTAGFAPYVDTTLYPPFNLVATARATGVKQFNLAFVVAGGGNCTPEWGGVTAIGNDPVASQVGALRAIGGDVRVSFGGEAGNELAVTCTSASRLQAAYQQVISAYHVNKIDFDIEGAALANAAANARRDQAIAALQAADPGLQASFTLPAIPSGLTADGIALLDGAVRAGVRVAAVDVMAMDYGDGAAPGPGGQMGTYAIDAATAADAQVATALGISDGAAWSKVAVTPMIGVNDISDEVFTLANAAQLAAFAASRHLAWLSMWSAARDVECPGGAKNYTQPTCSGVVQAPNQFMDALGSY
jgi:hypothetical protein